MKAGIKRRVHIKREWVAPRCLSPGINKSTSEITDNARSSGTFTFTLRIFAAAFPVRYPREK